MMSLRNFFTDLYAHMEWADASVWISVLGSEVASSDRVDLAVSASGGGSGGGFGGAEGSGVSSSPSPSHHRVLDDLQHIHLVQRAFLSIWRHEAIDVHAGEGLSPAELASFAQSYYGLARCFITAIANDAFEAPVQVPWTKQVVDRLGFEPAATSLTDTLVQVYAHTAHHRGQVMSRMRELGVAPPLADYIAWVWQGRPAAVWG